MKPDAANNPFLAKRKPGEPNIRSRSAVVDSVNAEKRTVIFSFSSDVDLERWNGFYEKLDHANGACDLTRLNSSAAMLFNHNWDDQIGVVERSWIKDGKGYVECRFSKSERGEEFFQDVIDGIRKNVSVGYEVLADELTRSDETGDHYTVTRWAPYEVSLVSVPADISVGVGRQHFSSSETKTNRNMEPTTPASAQAAAPAATPAPTPAVVVNENRASQFEDAKTILEIGKRYNAVEEAAQAVSEGKTVREFQEVLLERAKKAQAARVETPLGLSKREVKQFSIARVAAVMVAEKNSLGELRKLRDEASFELEVCEAAANQRIKQSGRAPKGFYIPREVLARKIDLKDIPAERRAEFEASQRAVVSISSTLGNASVGDTFVPTLDVASFAELLRPECQIMNLATVVDGLSGDYEIPKHISGALGGWVGEDGVAPGQNAVFTMLKATPHTCGGLTEVTRRALLQSALDLESLLRIDLARGVGQTIDLAAYYGTGANGQPKGIAYTDGVKVVPFAGTVSGTDSISPEFTELVKMETVIGQGNVKIDPANGAYVTNVYGRGWAKTRQKFPGTPTGATIWEPGDSINGYRAAITNQVQNGHWFLGNWKELFMALWSGLDLLVDPFTGSASGRVRIVALQDMDYLIRRPEAFAFGFK